MLETSAKTQIRRRHARMLSSPVTLHGSIELFPHQHGAGEGVSDEVTSGDRRPRSAEQSAPDHFLTVGDGRGSRRPHTHDFLWRRRRRDRARPWAARGLPLGQGSPASARGGRAPPFDGAARLEPRPRSPAPWARAAASACCSAATRARSPEPRSARRRLTTVACGRAGASLRGRELISRAWLLSAPSRTFSLVSFPTQPAYT